MDWKYLYYKKVKDYYKERSLVLLCSTLADVASHNTKANR